jgi:hypothetical protein
MVTPGYVHPSLHDVHLDVRNSRTLDFAVHIVPWMR